MLRNEIEPFANAQIETLKSVREEIAFAVSDLPDNASVHIEVDMLKDWLERLGHPQEAFVRFRVCMLDEVDQKFRLRDRLIHEKIIP